MSRLVISSPNTNSHALRLLAEELSARVGYKVWRVTPDRVGRRKAVEFHHGIDKVTQFERFMACDVSAPAFATTLETAKALPGELVVVRNTVTGSEGLGIQIVSKEEVSTHAPLYTEYIKKKKEFRVHVWDGKVIDVQEKRRKDGFESAKVRNTANGYVFCRMGIRPPAGLDSLAVSAVAALGRTYGGVDIIWNEHHNKSYVLEVNSRPGMEGTTVTKYADAILSAAYYAEGEML